MSDNCEITPAPEKALAARTAIAAPPDRVWRALTEPEELAQWWAAARVDLPGGVYEVQGPRLPQAAARPVTRLASYREGVELTLHWPMYGSDTVVTLELISEGEGTVVEARQVGVRHSDLLIIILENLRLHCLGHAPQCYDYEPKAPEVNVAVDMAAPRSTVFNALLDPGTMDRFWSSGARIDPQVGGDFDYGWGGDGPLKILELVPNERLSISWREAPQAPPTIVTWLLTDSGGGTRVTLVHSGFGSPEDCDGVDIGWFGFLLQLKALLELRSRWERVDIRSYTVEPA